MQLNLKFFVCDAPDQYAYAAPIFDEGDGRYATYIPARASRLPFWVTGGSHGQIAVGWPSELANERMCFQLVGGAMYESVIRHRETELDWAVNRMIDFEN